MGRESAREAPQLRRTPETPSGEVLASALECVEQLERAVCGESGVGSPAYAEGRALSGLRAAGIRDGQCPCPSGSSKPAPVVVHTPSFSGAAEDAKVILVSGSHQSALENCLVARRVAETLGIRVEHAIDPGAAGALGLARLPGAGQIAELLPDPSPQAAGPGGDIDSAVAAAFEFVREAVSGSAAPVRSSGNPKAPVGVVMLATGTAAGEQLVGQSGLPIRLVEVLQCKPFPSAALETALAGSKVVVFVAAAQSSLHHSFFGKLSQLTGASGPAVLLDDAFDSPAELARVLSAKLPPEYGKDLESSVKALGRNIPALSIAVHPAGSRGRGGLLKTGAALWSTLGLCPGDLSLSSSSGWLSLKMGRSPGAAELDLVVLFEDELAGPIPDFQLIRRSGGVILAAGRSLEPSTSWRQLPEEVRLQIEQGDLKLWWVNVSAEEGFSGNLLSSAILSAISSSRLLAGAKQPKPDPLPALQQLDPKVLNSSLNGELVLRAGPELPQMDRPLGDEETVTALLRQFLEFHLAGSESAAPGVTPHRGLPLVPALFLSESLTEAHAVSPFFLPGPSADENPAPLSEFLSGALGSSAGSTILGRALHRVLDGLASQIPENGSISMDRLKEAVAGLESQLDLSAAGKEQLSAEIQTVQDGLPKKGTVVRIDGNSWSAFYQWALSRERNAIRLRLLDQIDQLITDLEALLLVDEKLKPASRTAPSISSSLGSEGSHFIDAGRLSGIIPPARGSKGLSQERRDRIVSVCRSLKRFHAESARTPALFVFQAESLDTHFTGAETITSDDPFDAALGLFDGLAARVIEAMKAVRIGNLELAGEFNPEVHSGLLEAFTWEALNEDEVLLLPSILVVERVSGLPRRTLPGFHRLLQSGMPIHVAVLIDGAQWSDEELLRQLRGVLPDPGFLGLAHREAFVLQSSICRPDHLLAGLSRLMHAPGPAVLVLGFANGQSEPVRAWPGWLTAWLSRTVPFYSYDPWRGESWADRFSLDGNLHPENAWVTAEFACRDGEGKPQSMSEAITFAHFAALDSRFRNQFQIVPGEFESERLVPVSEYLDRFPNLPDGALPFIWVLTEQGEKVRKAVITRDLLAGCRDRSRAWRILQELAGLRNAYVERAVSKALEEATRKAQADLESAVEEARLAGATEAVEKLVTALSNPDALLSGAGIEASTGRVGVPHIPESQPSAQVAILQAEEKAESAAPGLAPEPAEEEEEPAGDPYIDSFLCTSCNDCINLNSRMFKYNNDRQAYIEDASQGTFRELVRAAESCPASCIHPGQPRPGDTTATPELVERAKAFH